MQTIRGVVGMWLLGSLLGCGSVEGPSDPGPDAGVDAPIDAAGEPDAPGPDAEVVACPPDYAGVADGDTDHCYRLVGGQKSWDDAQADCADDAEGSTLVIVDSEGELDGVVAAFPQAAAFWVGTTDRVTEGTFIHVTGGVFTLNHLFVPGEPNDSPPTGEDCLMVLNGGFNDGVCIDPFAFVCEVAPSSD